MGGRASPTGWPRARRTAFVGSGLGVSSVDWNDQLSSRRAFTARAVSTSPLPKAAIISPTSSPHQCVPTPMTPTAPTASSGSVSLSSPL